MAPDTMTLPHGELDFETCSEAGFIWNEAEQKWDAPPAARSKGLFAVGSAAYAEHPTTDILTLSYRLPGYDGPRRWRPGEPLPYDLFAYLAAGGVIEAHNSMFEWLIWVHVATPRYGFPAFSPYQLRCSMAKARVASYPGGLAELSRVLALPTPKDADGKRLLDKFSIPRKPTKSDPRRWIRPEDDPADFERLRAYCDTDTMAERQASERLPDMTEAELLFWWVDQEINFRGIAIDRAGVHDCIAVLNEALAAYGQEFREMTGGLNPTQLEAARGWLSARGVHLAAMDEAAIDEALARPDMPSDARRVLEVRQRIGSASVKKLFAMENQASRDNRLRNLIVHHGARTGRPTGEGPQPLNLPRAGPDLKWCMCDKPFALMFAICPWCGKPAPAKVSEWKAEAVDHVLEVMAVRSLALVEYYFGDALLCISGCLRGLFVAGPGMDLIASDYSAIEAVVLAMLAGEQWRIDAFRRGDPIYLVGASKITGRTVQEYLDFHADHGHHHTDRQTIGKVSELACGFGGWIGSFRALGANEPNKEKRAAMLLWLNSQSDEEVKRIILAWRKESPAIVEFWGGQFRGSPWDPDQRQEYYGVEGAAVQALLYPGHVFDYHGIKFYKQDSALVIRLLSGREMRYNDARLTPAQREYSRPGEYMISYMTWNTNPKYGPVGWVAMSTYGGRLTENIVQATAHDILRHAILALRAAGYPTVLHVYDEVVVEVPRGLGSVAEVERIMSVMPAWAADWPVVASGGWRGYRYRKG